ncbi:hypothetical protein ADK86_26215 [Streptomyces sp. NRRL F-5755]|nr:hypothetical protein ADK86_26215 [Streptomyces sp. NRRL F-5755]
MVLLDRSSGKYWQLNATGALVLRTLLEGATSEKAVHDLAERYPAAAHRAADDVDLLIGRLRTAGLIGEERV